MQLIKVCPLSRCCLSLTDVLTRPTIAGLQELSLKSEASLAATWACSSGVQRALACVSMHGQLPHSAWCSHEARIRGASGIVLEIWSIPGSGHGSCSRWLAIHHTRQHCEQ
eukprot:13241052-Alexandrium_andersonii.AAC.1